MTLSTNIRRLSGLRNPALLLLAMILGLVICQFTSAQERGNSNSNRIQRIEQENNISRGESGRQESRVRPQMIVGPKPRLGFYGNVIAGYGMQVSGVIRGSLAQRMGLERGDVILRVNGRRIRSQADYDLAMWRTRANGGYVQIKVRNVRSQFDPRQPRYVTVDGYLPGYRGPIQIQKARK